MTKGSSSEKQTSRTPNKAKSIGVGVQASGKEVLCAHVADQLLAQNTFKTLRDTDEILCYSNGLYHFNGEAYVAELVESEMREVGGGGLVTSKFVNEIVGHIRRRTYIDRQELNSEPNLLNLENGILNLDNFELRDHDKHFLSTIRIPIQFNPDARCPRIDKFLKEIVDPEHAPFLYEIVAWCLDTSYLIRYVVLLLGEGANGKSTYLELLRTFLGKGNCSAIPLQAFSWRFSLAGTYGKLANIYADLSSRDLYDTSVLKLCTGGDMVRGESKFKNEFYFHPTAKLVFSANIPPKIEEDTLAIWRRFITLQFPKQFIGAKQDKHLLSKLTTPQELSGLLNVALAALKHLRETEEFSYAPSSGEVRETYLISADPVQAFLEERCYITPEKWISKEDMFHEFIQFCSEKHVPGYTKTKLGRVLAKQRQIRSQGTGWQGITLKRLVSGEEISEQGNETVVRLHMSSN